MSSSIFQRLAICKPVYNRTQRRKQLQVEALETRRMLSASDVLSQVPVDGGPAALNSVKRYTVLGDDSHAQAALAEMGITKIKSFKHFDGLAVHLSGAEVGALRTSLGDDFRIVRDEPFKGFDDVEVSIGKSANASVAGGNPGGSGGGGQQTSWGVTAINADDAHAVTKGAGVAVCIVDSGLDMDHPDLAANIAGGANYINGGSPDDDNGHGTHVGGIVAAVDNSTGVLGVAPEATLLAAKSFDRRGTGTHGDIADGILGCLDLRDQHTPNMPLVINMSFNTQDWQGADAIIRPAVLTAYDAGATLVTVAGNESLTGIFWRPGVWPEVNTITGIQEDLSFWPDSNTGGGDFSSSGIPFVDPVKNPEFTGPASNILSLYKKGATNTLSGTSMSAAFASGVFALGLSAESLGAVGVNLGLPVDEQGAGLIDAELTVLNASVNTEPVAVDDSSATSEDLAITIDVLSNDSDDDGDPLTIGSVTQGSNGSVIINADNTLTYTPNANFNGPDTLTYQANDGRDNSNSAWVTITVNPINDVPVAFDDIDSTTENVAVTTNVMANDTLGDEPTLISSFSQGANGTVSLGPTNETTTYTPNSGFTGVDLYTYTITDSDGETDTATVSVTVSSQVDIDVIYVWDIDFESRQRGRNNTDYRVVVDVRHDSNFNLVAEAADASMAGVQVTVEFADSFGNVQTLSGTTDSSGVFRSAWLKGLATGDHRAEVVDLALAGFIWDPDGLDATDNDDDSDMDGEPDDILTI